MSDPVIAQKSPIPLRLLKEKNIFGALAARVPDSPFATDLTREQIFYRKPIPHPLPELCIFADANTQKARRCVMAHITRCSLTLRG